MRAAGRAASLRLLTALRAARCAVWCVLRCADVREKLASKLVEEKFSKGAVVFKQGEPGNKLYIIKDGEVDVMVGSKQIDHLYQAGRCPHGRLPLRRRSLELPAPAAPLPPPSHPPAQPAPASDSRLTPAACSLRRAPSSASAR